MTNGAAVPGPNQSCLDPSRLGPYRAPMIVVTNRIPVASGHERDFEERFRNRAGLVDQSPGFIRNEIHRPKPMRRNPETGSWEPDPDSPGHYEVKTWWRSFDDFVVWTRSESFAEAHRQKPPSEMFRGKNELAVHEVLSSSGG